MPHLIYVIDDEKPIREVLKRTLEKAAFKVMTFADGREALRQLESLPPQMILLDITMPAFSGMDFLDAIQRTHPQVPIFMLTAVFDVEATKLAISKGARDYLQKPFDMAYLVRYLKDYLNKAA